MAVIRIPGANWQQALVRAFAHVADGDTLIVPHEQARTWARRELRRVAPECLAFLDIAAPERAADLLRQAGRQTIQQDREALRVLAEHD
jgi:hypothetical protein